MVVRLLVWQLNDDGPSLAEIQAQLETVEPPEAPGVWLVNEAQERVGVLLLGDDDEVPPSVSHLRAVLGRDPDLYEEFDAR